MFAAPNIQLTAALGDRYRVERALGSGGMATVYLADDLKHRRKVAIKVLKPELASALGRERFFREIALTASLQHPHILPLFDSGEVPAAHPGGGTGHSLLFYVMPYVEGESLRERLRREHVLPIDEAIAITRDVADALTHACARGVVHRDIKPENILLRRDGDAGGPSETHALVADFGIARALAETGEQQLTQAGVTLGTPAYMSPEQAYGDHSVDGRSDVYALGCVLYEMLAGEPPFTGPTARSVISKHLTDAAPDIREARDRVPEHVAAAISKALAKTSADRFATARQFADSLIAPATPTADGPRIGRPTAPGGSRKNRRAMVVVAATAVAVVAAGAVLAVDAGGLRTRLTRPFGRESADRASGGRSIAVLPFHNVGGNPDEEYFSDGLTEELTAALAQLRSLRVAARTSSFAFKGKTGDVREVARRLNVATVLSGSVRKADDRIRITAQLIDAKTGLDLWSQTYEERELAQVFDIQTDIARRIALALQESLTPSEERRLAEKSTQNLEAYTLYLKGRYYWNKRGAQLDTAIQYFNRAIAIDSQYARAYAGLASAYGPAGVHGYIHPREGRERMREAARRALELDTESAEAHTVLAAYFHVYEWDWDAAEREFKRAIELDRHYSTAHSWYGHFLENMGRFTEAIDQRRLAAALDPLIAMSGVGSALALAGRYDDAKAAYQEALELDPNYWQAHEGLGELFVVTGDLADGIAAFERAVVTSSGTTRTKAELARALALGNRRADARALLRQVRDEAAATGIQHPEVAAALLAVGDTTAAFDWLDASFRQRHPAMPSIAFQPAFVGFRGDPRFQDLLRRVGLPDPTKVSSRE